MRGWRGVEASDEEGEREGGKEGKSSELTLSRGDHSELRESDVVADSESDSSEGYP